MILASIDWNPVIIILAPSTASLIAAIATYIQARANHRVIQDVRAQTNGQMTQMQNQISAIADNTAPVKVDHP